MSGSRHIKLQVEDAELRDEYTRRAAAYATSTDSGFDLIMTEDTTLYAGEIRLIDLGVRCEPGFEGGYYLYPRSSIGKTNLRLANSVGIIDNGYRGTLKVWVHNTDNKPYEIWRGERSFQLCHPSLLPMQVKVVDAVNMDTERGEGGFGSTGR
jgi:dUTP pyrophosphatase